MADLIAALQGPALTHRVDKVADKWMKLSALSCEDSASLNLNHEIYKRALNAADEEELDRADMRIVKYTKMKAEQTQSRSGLKSAREFDLNETHPAEIEEIDFSKHDRFGRVDWKSKKYELLDFCAVDVPNEIGKRKEIESENKRESTICLHETILAGHTDSVDFEQTIAEFQASEFNIPKKYRSHIESFAQHIGDRTSKIVPPPHSARIQDPEKSVYDFNKSVIDVIERHDYIYSESDSSDNETDYFSSEEESISAKLEKLNFHSRSKSQPPDSRRKLPVIGKSGELIGYKSTPKKNEHHRSRSANRLVEENKENYISDDEIEINPRCVRRNQLPIPRTGRTQRCYSTGCPPPGNRSYHGTPRTPRYKRKDGSEILPISEQGNRTRQMIEERIASYMNSPASKALSARSKRFCRNSERLNRSFAGFSRNPFEDEL